MKSTSLKTEAGLNTRTGSKSIKEIPPDVMEALNLGKAESKSLVEGLAVNFKQLMEAAFPDIARAAAAKIDGHLPLGITKRMEGFGALLHEAFGSAAFDRAVFHPSDTVRGWAVYALAADNTLSIVEKISRVISSANDPHFGVREWAQLALRPDIAKHLHESISLLTPWTAHASENIRRFAVEATRPRGVWTSHIAALKAAPELAAPLLTPVMADPSRYVQNSVGNWLNDAAKSRPDWVNAFLKEHRRKNDCPAFRYIEGRATRSVSP
jgi:3-methyladenine DNA glycosylase AlkC